MPITIADKVICNTVAARQKQKKSDFSAVTREKRVLTAGTET